METLQAKASSGFVFQKKRQKSSEFSAGPGTEARSFDFPFSESSDNLGTSSIVYSLRKKKGVSFF